MAKHADFNKLTCKIVFTRKSDGKSISLFEVNKVQVEKNFKDLTDTCKITIPRNGRWLRENSSGFNSYKIIGARNGSLSGSGLVENETSSLLNVGDKVEVYLGYDFENKLVFKGYLTEFTPSTPFVLRCEDAMWKLKQNNIVKSFRGETTLDDLKEILLAGTGVELHPSVNADEIKFQKLRIDNLTTAKVLAGWRDNYGLQCFIKEGKLVVGRTHFADKNSVAKTSKQADYMPPTINVQHDVPIDGDGLEVNNVGANQIALEANSIGSNNSRHALTVALNPADVNELVILAEENSRWTAQQREAAKREISANVQALGLNPERFQTRSLHLYNMDRDEILKAAKDYFASFVSTGLEGSLMLFGDRNLEPATTINLLDKRNPEKNGEYLIRGVTHVFGQGGYRVTINIPYKIRDLE